MSIVLVFSLSYEGLIYMHNKERLIEYLKKFSDDRFVPAKELAEVLDVTDRTIRNYIKSINTKKPDLIITSRDGYKYVAKNNYGKNLELTDQSIDSRRFYILRRLFKSSVRGIDVFDLADALYISDASVRSDIVALSRLSEKYDLVIRQKEGRYILEGNDKNKRRLMIQLIRSTNHDGSTFNVDIQKFLDSIPFGEVVKITKTAFKNHNLKTNSYFLKNFVLHLAIAIDRARGISQLIEESEPHHNKKYRSYNIINEIRKSIFKEFSIKLLLEDVEELNILCEGEFRNTSFDLLTFVEPKVHESVNKALGELSKIYLIDFSEKKFKNRLLLHIQSLYKRSQEKNYSRNLSLMEIKVKYPVLFDMAIYLSSILSNDLKITISDEEIAFLALHIGSFVDSQKKSDKQIKTTIITPSYNTHEIYIKDRIEKEFEDELKIEDVVEDILDLSNEPELIISTQSILETDRLKVINIPVIIIKEFLTPHDVNQIRRKIEQIKCLRYKKFLETYLLKAIPEEFYLEIKHKVSKEEVFRIIESVLVKKEYVPSNFRDMLKEREKISPTAFPSGIAVPHSIKYDAYKTGLYVINSKETVKWSNLNVNLIIALSVDKNDSEEFNKIFPRMVELLAEEINVRYLHKSLNRQEFITRMIDLMVSEDYYE